MSYEPALYEAEKRSGRRRRNGALNLTKLTGKHLRVIALHCAGLKAYQIAEEMHVTAPWVSTILNDPLAQAEIHQQFVELDNELFAKATNVVSEKLTAEDPAIALRAADMVWRARGRYEKKDEGRVGAEELVQMLLARATDHGKAEISVTVGPQRPTIDYTP